MFSTAGFQLTPLLVLICTVNFYEKYMQYIFIHISYINMGYG